jgi:glycosyltransferase involved in cell wall biosynthesis
MKLLMVGHSFLSAYNQTKYAAMKQLNPELRLRLVVPSRMRLRFGSLAYEVHSALSSEEAVPLKARFTWCGQHMTYLHNPARMAAILRNFQPDVIHIEEEPHALITVETIALQRTFARSAAVTVHECDNILRARRFPLGAIKHILRAYSLRRIAAALCANQRSAELLGAEGYFQGFIEILPQYGFDAAELHPGNEPELRAELGLQEGVVIGHVGRLAEEKGLRLLIEALDRLQAYPWKLLLLGAGPLESEIRERWMAKFPGRIVLVPAVPLNQVAPYVRCSDIFVLASYSMPNWQEQFGASLAQAMLTGLPSIGSTSGAIPEVVGPGGIIFKEKQTDDLARALEELLASPARRRELGALGREFALRNYSKEVVAARYLAAFERARSVRSKVSTDASTMIKRTEAERDPSV